MPSSRLRSLCAAVSLSILALAAAAPVLAQSDAAKVPAEKPADWGSFGVQTKWMDKAAKPGDDFDRFVNGKWNDVTRIPDDKTRIGAFITLRDLSDDRLHAILDGLVAAKPAPGSDEARIADAYTAFLNTDAINAAGLAPAQPWLDRIQSANTMTELVALFGSPGFASPIEADVDADDKQSDRYALYLGQGGLGLPDRDYYLSDDAKYRDIRAKYVDYLTVLLEKARYVDARASAEAVLGLETRMAVAGWDRALSRNRDLTYNKLTLAELDALDPSHILTGFIRDLGAGAATDVIVAQMPPTPEELAAAKFTPAMAAKLGGGVPATVKIITETPLKTWKAYLTAHFLSDHASVLPQDIDTAQFAFFGTMLSGQPVQRARWRRAIGAVEGQVGELVGKIYADRYYPAANRAAMNDLVANLRKAMAANLSDLAWMGPETRAQAEAKLAAFTPKIGAPETYKAYEGLVIGATTPLANRIAAQKWDQAYRLARIGKPVDRSEWFMFPQTVNAYYNPTFNEIVFPAAILQPPFFNLSADPAVNYGGIGAVIGHEMGHGFDDQGSKSDGAGNLRDWWTPQDKAAFEALTGKLVAQYAGFCPFDAGKTCVNGELTLGENIGDIGGLSLAYRAYKLSLNGKPAPVIGGYTGDQRFFLSWAQVWRSKVRDEQARQFLVTDPHSPPQYRVNGVVRNFDEWYRAFDVKPGDKLYLPPDKRVRIW